LSEARVCHGLCGLGYAVTGSHIPLLVRDPGRGAIAAIGDTHVRREAAGVYPPLFAVENDSWTYIPHIAGVTCWGFVRVVRFGAR